MHYKSVFNAFIKACNASYNALGLGIIATAVIIHYYTFFSLNTALESMTRQTTNFSCNKETS